MAELTLGRTGQFQSLVKIINRQSTWLGDKGLEQARDGVIHVLAG